MWFSILLACANPENTQADSSCNETTDANGDDFSSCEEEVDPNLDSDGDGYSDLEEEECNSDPYDNSDACYACGWPHGDPGGIISTGATEGSIIANMVFVDQCGETLKLWDFADGYNVLYMTAQWCGACAQEVGDLPDKADRFEALYGFPVRYLIGIFENNESLTPEPEVAEAFAERTEMSRFPVLADVQGLLIESTPYDGTQLPGKCALSPEMEILGCATGSAAEEYVFALIVEHSLSKDLSK